MRVWTVHPLVVWERLKDAGTLSVDPAFHRNGYLPWQYQWLAGQMRERVPGYRGGLPWFAYCEKPDLRWVRHSRPVNEPQVRIEVELDPDRVLAFPLWAWDLVYCGQFIAFTKREHDAWHAALRKAVPDEEDRWPFPEPWQGELEASWRRLFDPQLPARGWKFGIFDVTTDREAVFDLLSVDDVRSVKHFVGTFRMPQRRPTSA